MPKGIYDRKAAKSGVVPDLAIIVKEARNRLGLSQRAVARASDVGVDYYQLIEQGRVKNPNLNRLADIARTIGIPLGRLTNEPEPPRIDIGSFAGRR